MRPEDRIRRFKPEHYDGTRTARARHLAVERRLQRRLKNEVA